MSTLLRSTFWGQFGASIDMIENSMHACPEELWGDRSRQPEFWYLVYHTLFWLDMYLSEREEGFTPPAPFTLEELDPAGVLPPRVYSKDELQDYLDHCRNKLRRVIESLSEETASERRKFGTKDFTLLEMMLYNMRHVQHHAAQLNQVLRQATNSAPRWVRRTPIELN